MIGTISGTLLILLAFLAMVLQRLYSSIPARELKRLARRGDHLAKSLYRPVAYGSSLRLLLWSVVGIGLSSGVLLVLAHVPTFAGFALLAVLLGAFFVWVPSMRMTVRTARVAASCAPVVVKVLYYFHAPFDYVARFIDVHRELPRHSRMYERQDLQELITLQQNQPDNRISQEDLDLASRALAFNDKHAGDIAQPRGDAHLVDADDTIGPVLLDQLHKSKQVSFLVYKDSKDNILGSLAMRDAVAAKKGGRVFDLVHSDLTFLHEDFTLRQVLDAFQKTGHNVGVVINRFEEFIGVVTLEMVLQELVGESYGSVVTNYEDRAMVAAYQPQQPEIAEIAESGPQHAEVEPEALQTDETSPESTEVVE